MGVSGSFAGVFVFAVGVDVDALGEPSIELLFPCRQLLRGVVFKTQASVGEISGEHIGRSLFFGFGQAEGGVVPAKRRVGFVGVPRGVANFESETK